MAREFSLLYAAATISRPTGTGLNKPIQSEMKPRMDHVPCNTMSTATSFRIFILLQFMDYEMKLPND